MQAYHTPGMGNKPTLIAVVPHYPVVSAGPNVRLIRQSLNHEQLVSLYQGALGFVFPSLHESFGLPIVEAMACGCPVITSNTTACAEIAGDAALLVDPRSVADIAAALERLINDEALRRTLRERGLARAAAFTWERSAQEHLQVFVQATG